MALVDRVKNICVSPNTEWPVIAAEPATAGGLITGYALPLMAIGAVAGFIGGSIVGMSVFGSTYRTPFVSGIVFACVSLVVGVLALFILSFLINALAPTFGGQQNSTQAMKVAVYSYTPAWVAGVLGIVPGLAVLAIIGSLYGLYLLYLGLPVLMKAPQDKAVGYTVVVIVCAIVLSILMTFIVGAIGFGAAATGAFAGSALSSSSPAGDVQFDKDSPLGKLQELGKSMEQSSKQMEAAQKSGDAGAQANAATNMLGALFGGGKKIDPLEIDQLKTFIPATFVGLSKDGSDRAEKNGMGSFMVSKAEADYSDGEKKNVHLEVTDAGAASGLMGFASWAAAGQQKDDASGSERTIKSGGRLVHERRAKNGGTNEYSVVLADRFMVTAKSSDFDVDALKSAVSSLDLGKLESMKDVGVQKP